MDVDGDGVRMVKVVCPICGKMGVLEIRGNSRRVVHYYYENGKRIFVKHTVKREQWERWEQKMGTENKYEGSLHEIIGGRSLAWTRTSACHAEDPGSNPGGRTIQFDKSARFNEFLPL